jgi:hypothetical protein
VIQISYYSLWHYEQQYPLYFPKRKALNLRSIEGCFLVTGGPQATGLVSGYERYGRKDYYLEF